MMSWPTHPKAPGTASGGRHGQHGGPHGAVATGWGANKVRLSRADAATRADLLARVHRRLGRLVPEGYRWEGEIICAVATKDTARM
jgi:hypothetical protein